MCAQVLVNQRLVQEWATPIPCNSHFISCMFSNTKSGICFTRSDQRLF